MFIYKFLLVTFLINFSIFAQSAKANFILPQFDTEEAKFFSEHIENKNVIISFWASYCLPCKKELQELQKLVQNYPQVTLILIGIDVLDDEDKAKAMIKEIGMEGLILWDKHQIAYDSYLNNKKLGVPASFVVDKKGKIKLKIVGYKNDTIMKIEKEIKKLP